MNQSDYWTKAIGLPKVMFKDSFDINCLKLQPISSIDKNNFSEELIDWFSDSGVYLRNSSSFYRSLFTGNIASILHRDIRPNGELTVASINVELVGRGVMYFYKEIKPKPFYSVYNTEQFTPYIPCVFSDVTLLDTLEFEKEQSYLVRTEEIHSVLSNTPERLVLSLRFDTPKGKGSWENIKEILSENNKIDTL